MSLELRNLISEKINRERQDISGHALSSPYLSLIGGEKTWVVDVLIQSDAEILEKVPIAEAGRNVRDFVNEGTPITLQRSVTGQMYIIGLADRQRGKIVKKTYSIRDAGLAFQEGWRKNETNDWETGNENYVAPTTEEVINYSYAVETVSYGNLKYGTDIYGKTTIVRSP